MAAPNTPTPRRVPKLCKHKATGQGVVRLDGKDHYCGCYGTRACRDAYDRLVAEWLQCGRQLPRRAGDGPAAPDAQPGRAGGPSLSEVVLAYKRFADEYYRESPKERDRIRLALRPLRRLYGRTPAADFGPLAFKAVRRTMLDVQTRTVAVRNNKRVQVGERVVAYRLSLHTINMRANIVKRLFAWAVENELVPGGVHHALLAVRPLKKNRSTAKEPRKVRPVPDADVEKVLPLLPAPVRAMVELQRLTGARSGEVCSMRGGDIDRSGAVWVYRPRRFKGDRRDGDRRREVFLGLRAQEVVLPFLKGDSEAYLFSPAEAMALRYAELRSKRKSKVPPSQRNRRKARPRRRPGGCYTVASYRRAVQTACRRASVALWHPHQLRHSAATRLRKEFGIEMARIILGHASAVVTELYAEADRAKATDIMSRVG